jgi:hypothetical protein
MSVKINLKYMSIVEIIIMGAFMSSCLKFRKKKTEKPNKPKVPQIIIDEAFNFDDTITPGTGTGTRRNSFNVGGVL